MPSALTSSSFAKAGNTIIKRMSELVRPEVSHYTTGLHIGRQNIILTEFECKKDEVILINLAHEKAGNSAEQNSEILSKLFSRPDFLFKRVAVSVPRESAVVRIITFPLMDDKQLKASLEFEAEKYVPYNLSEIYFDCQPLIDKEQKSQVRQMKVLLAACKRDVVMNLIHTIQKSHGQVDVINLDSLAALGAFLNSRAKDAQVPAAMLDMGTNVSNLSMVDGNKLVFLRDISFGGADLTQALVKNLQMGVDEAEKIKMSLEAQSAPYEPVLRAVIEKIVHEVKITIHYVEGQLGKPMNLKQLHLAGGMARNPILQESVRNFLKLEPVIWDPLKGIKIGSRVNTELVKNLETVLPVSVGLALG